MPVSRVQLMKELQVHLLNSGDIADDVADIGDQVEYHWKGLARIELDAGYSTGQYEDSIHRVSSRGRRAKGSVNAAGKRIGGQFYWRTKVVTRDPIAHFIEYGTGPDDAPNYPKPPKNKGHWTDLDGKLHFWWNTPTRAYNLAGQTEMDFS